MCAEMLEELSDVLLSRVEERTVPLLKKLGKCFQVAVVGFARERTQAFLHAKVSLVILQQRKIGRSPHIFDYLGGAMEAGLVIESPNHVHQGIKSNNMNLGDYHCPMNNFCIEFHFVKGAQCY